MRDPGNKVANENNPTCIREIANDFVLVVSADRGVKWYADENRAMISRAGFQEGNQKLFTELSSVLFDGISCSWFLEY